MRFEDVAAANLKAFRRRDYAECERLLNNYLAVAEGEDRGKTLSLLASLISLTDINRVEEGLGLIDEALTFLRDNPGRELLTIVDALALCYTAARFDRVEPYEVKGHLLLKERADLPVVQQERFRLHMNLGLIAHARGHYTEAYWHHLRAEACLQALDAPDSSGISGWLGAVYLNMVQTCLRLRLLWDAYEALENAKRFLSEPMRLRWTLEHAAYWLHRGEPEQTEAILGELSGDGFGKPSDWSADNRVRFYQLSALLAELQNRPEAACGLMAQARWEAVSHGLLYLLPQIADLEKCSHTHQGVEK